MYKHKKIVFIETEADSTHNNTCSVYHHEFEVSFRLRLEISGLNAFHKTVNLGEDGFTAFKTCSS